MPIETARNWSIFHQFYQSALFFFVHIFSIINFRVEVVVVVHGREFTNKCIKCCAAAFWHAVVE
ncbi:hypothetical protein X975_17568, partial [Stegodyphus mimosarum]